ncbi:discoidin domain-containing protein [Pleionea sediminis]|uniref:galactose-binding domain-containing protein n=1 Tax=Pleionea sediminis TaxID=2569479 RepID=UPI0013DE2DD6|nr:discoidin domain-containing protein [Pleionea sediminis]
MNKALLIKLYAIALSLLTSLSYSSDNKNFSKIASYKKSSSENIAQFKKTEQSSISHQGRPSRAVDGNVDGHYFRSKSVTHTLSESSPWWKVDLGDSYIVHKVSLWNRTDCCGERLSNFHVDLLDKNGNILASKNHTGTVPNKVDIDLTGVGVYSVRVQLNQSGVLSLAEVKVWGTSGENLSLNKMTVQSSTSHQGYSSRAVDGNTDGHYFKSKSVTHTFEESSPWWKVDLGRSAIINKISLWNRTDCCGERLSNFNVELLDKNGSVIKSTNYQDTVSEKVDIDLTGEGVYSVRTQLNGMGTLSLAEAQVWGVSEDDYQGPFVEAYDFPGNAPWYPCPDESSFPEEVSIITAFDKALHNFNGGGSRDIETEVEFPSETYWKQLGLLIRLECPPNKECDPWDRSASIGLKESTQDSNRLNHFEIARYITPYRKGFCSYTDISPMANKLVGKKIITSWINTWVDTGFVVTVKFVFYPGERKAADQIINLWERRKINVGDPAALEDSIKPVRVNIPADAKRIKVKLLATGHGFGYTYNCAEFCQMRQDTIVNGDIYSVNEWRDDCQFNPVRPQAGTWYHNRNGWCPGAVSVGSLIDITPSIIKGEENTIDFGILLSNGSDYINTSDKDASPYELVSMKLYIYK